MEGKDIQQIRDQLVNMTDLTFLNNNIASQMTREGENNSKNGQYSVPSKYLASYIEQRKTLLLAKLSQNGVAHQSRPQAKLSIVQAGNQKGKVQEKDYMTAAKSRKGNAAWEMGIHQQGNKINKKCSHPPQANPSKFLARSNLYEKQRELKLQFQMKKHLYSSSNPSFSAHLHLKRDECKQEPQAKIASKEHQQCGYVARYEKKVKERTDEAIRYKDKIKKGEKNAPFRHRKASSAIEEHQRWVKIEEMFSKMTFSFEEEDLHNKIEEHQRTADQFPRQRKENSGQENIFDPARLTLKKTKSIEYNNDKMEMDLKEQFDEQLSGIMVNQDRRQELDTSNLIESVVNEMIFDNVQVRGSGKQQSEHKSQASKEVVQNVSILSGKKEEKEALPEQQQFLSKVPSIQDYAWLKTDEAGNQLQLPSPIQIQKVQSQIIENLPQEAYSQQSECKEIIINSSYYQQQNPSSPQVQPIQQQDTSIINQITQQLQRLPSIDVIQAQSQEQIQQQAEKQSLGALAAQFMKIATSNDSYESINILDEEQPVIVVESFNFNETTYQKIEAILSNTLPKPQPQPIPQIPVLQPVQDEPLEQFQQSLETNEDCVPQFPPRTMSNLKDFGECHFLVIPEESEEQSRQSTN